MSPPLTPDYLADRLGAHPIGSRYGDACLPFRSPDFQHLGFGQSRKPLPLTSCLPALLHHILSIALNGSKEEVIRPNTGPIITVVKHPEPIRDRAIEQLPRDPMGLHGFPVEPELPVSMTALTCRPCPAGQGTSDLFPEALSHGRTASSRIAISIPAEIMPIAQPPRKMGPFTAIDEASRLREHRNLDSRCHGAGHGNVAAPSFYLPKLLGGRASPR